MSDRETIGYLKQSSATASFNVQDRETYASHGPDEEELVQPTCTDVVIIHLVAFLVGGGDRSIYWHVELPSWVRCRIQVSERIPCIARFTARS